ncbi:hypothetical protein [Bowmanella denitrificans]|uniref:hypothetical protein n=1 Tax=Bowmanella denitrificans TaxID=366582 RepID=UPI001558C268|nr:hypothetical protein [Bowmanella denitrificans]
MTREQMIIALKDAEAKFKRNQEIAEETWPVGSPFLEMARQQAAHILQKEICAIFEQE